MRCPSSGGAKPPPLRIIYNFSVGRHPCVPPPDNHRAPNGGAHGPRPTRHFAVFVGGGVPDAPIAPHRPPNFPLSTFHFPFSTIKKEGAAFAAPPHLGTLSNFHASMPRLVRYFFTISATLKVMASSNSRRSSPVSFLIFSSRYTSVLRWTNSLRAVSDTLRLFSKNL